MEIIKRGVAPTEYVYEGTCSSCGTIIRCSKAELKSMKDPREPGEYVECPVCRTFICRLVRVDAEKSTTNKAAAYDQK